MQGRLYGNRRNRAFSSSTLRSVVVRWRSRVGQARRDGPTRPITRFDRGRTSVLQQARGTAAFCDLCWLPHPLAAAPTPGRPSLQGRTPPTLLSYTLLSPLRVALLPIGISTKPTPRIDSSTHGPRTLLKIVNSVACIDEFAHCRSSPRARCHQLDGRAWSDICFSELFSNPPYASSKRESRLLCRGTAEHQLIVSPTVPSIWSQTTLECWMTRQ
jgi:hypothetical protein